MPAPWHQAGQQGGGRGCCCATVARLPLDVYLTGWASRELGTGPLHAQGRKQLSLLILPGPAALPLPVLVQRPNPMHLSNPHSPLESAHSLFPLRDSLYLAPRSICRQSTTSLGAWLACQLPRGATRRGHRWGAAATPVALASAAEGRFADQGIKGLGHSP